jgi:hypothetical protein
MPFNTPFTLRGLVLHNISVISGFPEDGLTDKERLRYDLGMSAPMRRALAPGFQKIARQFKSDALVTMSDCESLDTVGDALKVVAKAAGVSPGSGVPSHSAYLAARRI